jgi:hypothetical protein
MAEAGASASAGANAGGAQPSSGGSTGGALPSTGGTGSGEGGNGGNGASSGGSGPAGGTAGAIGSGGAGAASGGSGSCVTDSGIEARYEPTGTGSEISAEIRIFNQSATTTTVSDFLVRYYLTQAGESTPSPVINHAGTQTASSYGGASVTAAVRSHSPAVDGADTIIEFTVSSTTAIAAGEYVRFQWRAGSGFTQTDDYSFDATATLASAYDRITIHDGGEQLWGCLPSG